MDDNSQKTSCRKLLILSRQALEEFVDVHLCSCQDERMQQLRISCPLVVWRTMTLNLGSRCVTEKLEPLVEKKVQQLFGIGFLFF